MIDSANGSVEPRPKVALRPRIRRAERHPGNIVQYVCVTDLSEIIQKLLRRTWVAISERELARNNGRLHDG